MLPTNPLPHDLPPMPGGYVIDELTVAGSRLRYYRPADPDALLDVPEVVAAFDRDGDAPYWTLRWPPAELMAVAVSRAGWPRGTTVLEVGCGIGLAGLAAAATGYETTVSDRQADAVRLAAASAALNGLKVEPIGLDWRRPIDRAFDVILGCEVIYDADLHEPLLGLIDSMLAPGGEVWLADHGRMHTPLFARRAVERGYSVELVDERDRPLADYRTGAYQLLKLRRRSYDPPVPPVIAAS